MPRGLIPAVVLALHLCLPAGVASAAVDPDLLVLEAKVNGVSAGLATVNNQIAVVALQFEELFDRRERAIVGLGEARRRDLEGVLLECALDPPSCVAPMLLTSALSPECLTPPPPPGPDPHSHDVGFDCPLKELVGVVASARMAAEEGGLDRDYTRADLRLQAAIAAMEGGDGLTAFREACAAFKYLACP